MTPTLLRRRFGFFSLLSLSLFIWSCKSGGSSEGESDKIHVIENHSQDHFRIEMSSTLTAFGNSKTRKNSPLLLLNFDKELESMRKAIYGNSGNFSEQTGLNLKEKLAN